MRKTASPPKVSKTSAGSNATNNQIVIQNAYGQSQGNNNSNQGANAGGVQAQAQAHQNQQNNQGGGGQGQVAAQANQMLVKRQLVFTQEQLLELQRAGRFGKQPVPQEYAVIQPQAPEFRGRKTLVLDLDETLIHSKFSEAHLRACRTRGRCDFQMRIVVEGRPIQVYVLIRPGVLFFLQKLASIYEIVLYTASMSIYANPLVDTLDQDQLIPMRLYREHCFSFQGSYIKDLSLLGRDMKDVIIVDNSPNAYYFHNENAVPILSWYDDPDDRCLFEMIPLLEALSQVHDVRQVIPKFVRKDINLVDFPKAAWVLNDAYRQMHSAQVIGAPHQSQNGTADSGAPGSPGDDQAQVKNTTNSKKVLTPTKQNSATSPTNNKVQGQKTANSGGKNVAALEDAYERKPSPINLKPLSPRTTNKAAGKVGGQLDENTSGDNSKIGQSQNKKERTFSPRQLKISSKQNQQQQVQEIDSQSIQQQQQLQNEQMMLDHQAAAKQRVQKKRSDTTSGIKQQSTANNMLGVVSPQTMSYHDQHQNQHHQQHLQTSDDTSRRDSRGKSQQQNPPPSSTSHRAAQGGHFSPIAGPAGSSKDNSGQGDPDEVAIDQVHQRRSRRKVSHQPITMKTGQQNESTDLEQNQRLPGTQDALENGLAAEATANNQLYQKVSQRKQIIQRHIAGQSQQPHAPNQISSGRRRPSANNNVDSSDTSRMSSPQSNSTSNGQSKNTSFTQGGSRVPVGAAQNHGVQLEINTNKAELAVGGPLVDLPPHLQKIMQARSTTNKTSSMARQGIVIPQGNIITPVNAGKLGNSHRIGTSNGLVQKNGDNQSNVGNGSQANGGTGLNATFQNIPKSNNLFQTTSQTTTDGVENLSQKRLQGPQNTGGTLGKKQQTPTENLNRSFSNQAGVTNGSLSAQNNNSSNTTGNASSNIAVVSNQSTSQHQQQSSTSWARDGGVMQHSSRLNGRRKLSRNEQAANPQTQQQQSSSTPTGSQISVQGNLSIRRGITRYQQATHQHLSGVMSSRNESQHHQGGSQNTSNVKLIGKNSLHMKRRSEYPTSANESSQSNQWHLPDASSSGHGGIITSESQKNTSGGTGTFNFQKQAPNAAWAPQPGTSAQNTSSQSAQQVAVQHSQSSANTQAQQKRVINQSVGQLSNVKHINSANLANVPATTGHKKVQSLLSNIQQRGDSHPANSSTGANRAIQIMQPGVGNTQPSGSTLNTSGLGSQSSSTRHRKPPMLVRTNHPQRLGVSQVPGTQPNSTQNRNRSRDQWMNFANIMHGPNGDSSTPTAATGQSGGTSNQLTPMNNMGGHKLSSDFIIKNGNATAAAQAAAGFNVVNTGNPGSPSGPSKQNYLGLMQAQPGSAQHQQHAAAVAQAAKAKFKQAKPLTNTRGKSVPQERPSNSQGNVNIVANAALAHTSDQHHHIHGPGAGNQGHSSATKSTSGIRISSHQRQQFISSSNKTIKTLKQFNQASNAAGGRQQQQQPHTADNHLHQQK